MGQLKRIVITSAAVAVMGGSVRAATISEDFEAASGSTPPSGWSFVSYYPYSGTPTYNNGTGYSSSGQGGAITAAWKSTTGHLPGGYIYDSGSAAFDANQSITGSFDFYVKGTTSQTYPAGEFIMGDIASGLAGTDAGQLVGADLTAHTFGNGAGIINGKGADFSGVGPGYFSNSTWYHATFSWTPTSGTTGDFSYSVYSTSNVLQYTLTASTTLTSPNVYFGFGAGQPTGYGTATATFDNISITQTPEPASLALLALGGMLTLRRRRPA